MIPVLIAPVVSRFDLFDRMLESVQWPVGRTVVVDNSCSGWQPPEGRKIEVIRPITGLGYGGGINAGILQTPDAPWWMWTSNDVVFGPTVLAQVDELMTEAADRPRLVTGGFTWGAVNLAAVSLVGLVDDNEFYPVYFDDNDYHRRCQLGGVEWMEIGGWTHGADGEQGSMTIKSSEALREGNHRSFPENHRRYQAKWGGDPGHELYKTPWNLGFPLWVTRPDIAGRAKRLW